MPRTITVPELTQPTRLDKFLVHELGSTWSRSALQQAIEQGQITINGRRVAVHHWLKAGEIITIALGAPKEAPHLTPNPEITFRIIEEKPDYLVLEKPAGLVVHPAPGVHEPTLADGLVARYPELTGLGDDPLRPGIVHRLDREVSGLMVVARTAAAFSYLKREFAERQVHKCYLALVVGQVARPEGEINFPLARSRRSHGKMAARPASDDDTRDAITHFTVEQKFQQLTLLKVTIATGRTHQIRAHLAALGHPIVGDRLYRPTKLMFKATPGRLFLHAAELGFTAPEGVRRDFTSPLPPELKQFLTTLHATG